METGLLTIILMLLGYGILFAYLFIILAKKEARYAQERTERSFKWLEEGVKRDIERLRDEIELRRELKK